MSHGAQFSLRIAAIVLAAFSAEAFRVSAFRVEAVAGDWPQILGPQRNGHAMGERLAEKWAAGSPRIVWTHAVGQGYAGPAVAAGKVIVFHRVADHERVECLEADTGKSAWKVDFPASYSGTINYDNGPRSVPLIHEGRVYVFGASGDLHCVDLANGAKRWSRATYEEFQGNEGYFGAGSTPLVVDDKLLVNVGGRGGAGIVAFALKDGKTVWKATDEGASYSSPIAAVIDGQPQAIFAARLNALAVDPKDGAVLWRFPFGQRGPTVTATTPVLLEDRLFLTAAYGVGGRCVKLAARGAETLWENDESLSSQYSSCVHHQGCIYGVHGREDFNNGELRCIDVATGKVRWAEKGFGIAHVIFADDKLLIVKNEGDIALARANPEKFESLATAQVFKEAVRALPALANGRLYARDSGPQGGSLKCIEVGSR